MERLYLDKNQLIDRFGEGRFDYAWINTFSELYLKKVDDITNFEFLDDLIEAKFFNNEEEMSIIKEENEDFSVVIFDNEENSECFEEKQILRKGKSPLESKDDKRSLYKLIVRHYIKYDSEGQAFIYYTKLCGIESEGDTYGRK